METNEMTGKISRTVDHVALNAHKTIDKISEVTRPAVEHVAAGAQQALNKVAGAANQAVETIDVKGRQLREAQLRLTENLRGQLRERPFTSVGIAVAAGFMLNWLLRQRPGARHSTE